jgi:hypothetical protein
VGERVQEHGHNVHILASPGEGEALPPPPTRLMANGRSRSLVLSSGGGKVHRQDPLCLKDGLVSRRLIWLGRSDRLLVGELASPLCRLTLGVNLLSMGLRLLHLLKGISSLKREPGVRPRHDGPRQNRHHGLKG